MLSYFFYRLQFFFLWLLALFYWLLEEIKLRKAQCCLIICINWFLDIYLHIYIYSYISKWKISIYLDCTWDEDPWKFLAKKEDRFVTKLYQQQDCKVSKLFTSLLDQPKYENLFPCSIAQFWYTIRSVFDKLPALSFWILMHFQVDPYPKDLNPLL